MAKAKPKNKRSKLRGGTEGGAPGEMIPTNDPVSDAHPPGPDGDDETADTGAAPRLPQSVDSGPVPGVRPGFNEGDPAVERKEGRSPGNMTHKSQYDPNDPRNPL